jgi:hypothetical protein
MPSFQLLILCFVPLELKPALFLRSSYVQHRPYLFHNWYA